MAFHTTFIHEKMPAGLSCKPDKKKPCERRSTTSIDDAFHTRPQRRRAVTPTRPRYYCTCGRESKAAARLGLPVYMNGTSPASLQYPPCFCTFYTTRTRGIKNYTSQMPPQPRSPLDTASTSPSNREESATAQSQSIPPSYGDQNLAADVLCIHTLWPT